MANQINTAEIEQFPFFTFCGKCGDCKVNQTLFEHHIRFFYLVNKSITSHAQMHAQTKMYLQHDKCIQKLVSTLWCSFSRHCTTCTDALQTFVNQGNVGPSYPFTTYRGLIPPPLIYLFSFSCFASPSLMIPICFIHSSSDGSCWYPSLTCSQPSSIQPRTGT